MTTVVKPAPTTMGAFELPPSAARYDHWNKVVQCRKIPIQKAAQTTQIRPFATKANAPADPSHPLKATQLCSRKSTHAPRKPFRSSATMTPATKPPPTMMGDFALPRRQPKPTTTTTTKQFGGENSPAKKQQKRPIPTRGRSPNQSSKKSHRAQ